ncbi:MAG: hypothetical protein ACRD63_00240 [Pyrinomonadaceae bacterium]
MVTIEVVPQVAAMLLTLQQRAEAQGKTLDLLLREIVESTADYNDQNLVLGESHDESRSPRNESMLAVIRRNRERLKDMPVRGSTKETLRMIREARGGAMWGYEPAE